MAHKRVSKALNALVKGNLNPNSKCMYEIITAMIEGNLKPIPRWFGRCLTPPCLAGGSEAAKPVESVDTAAKTDAGVQEQTVCRPWDRGDFMVRLQSFKIPWWQTIPIRVRVRVKVRARIT